MKPLRQIRLRTLFLVFICAAIGMTCATTPPEQVDPRFAWVYVPQLNVYHALLYSATVAVVLGLAVQAYDLFSTRLPASTDNREIRFARILAIVWRAGSASILFVCLFAHMLITRRFVQLPEHEDTFFAEIFPEVLALILVVFALDQSLARWRSAKPSRPAQRWITILAVMAGVVLAVLVLPDQGLIAFLVHVAISGIEAVQRFSRPGTYPDLRAEGFRTFWLSSGSVVILLLAVAVLFFTNYLRSAKSIVLSGAVAFLALLALDIAFCRWFYIKEFHRISIDMASVGFGANWFDWAAGALLISILASVVAYRLSVASDDDAEKLPQLLIAARVYVHESFWCLLLFIAAMAAYYIEEIRYYIKVPNFFWFGLSGVLGVLYSHLASTRQYIELAILVLSLQLCWTRWRRADAPGLTFPPIAPARFLCNWVAVELLFFVAVPTIAIYCFTFWLGPWYL